MKTLEPFGYFNNPALDGWQDCAETDEGARPLYDQDAIDALVTDRDELLAALNLCATKFRHYEAIHAAKPDPIKAADNAALAKMAEDVIAKTKGGA